MFTTYLNVTSLQILEFELIHIKERTTKKVSVPDIMELEREVLAIDLLSLHKDILEAQRRSGVDEKPKSRTLTTTPPASKRILEVSFSAPATTATTIHVSGDTKASTPFTDYEA
ncbi:hypothetical protein H5410_001790 [Solanum commersonii]|uniref:Uncharacterized protein n=1 Tax=Solanum commersonii TaxID=4109 RepID=A0A9J6B054_SOLCO|nr:hypothetical protein H5410_001790 [Solanum commersonii]